MSSLKAALSCLLLITGSLSQVCAVAEFHGRLSADLYVHRTGDQDHLRPYLRFRGHLLAWRGEDGRSLKFFTSTRWTTDVANKIGPDPQLFVYDTYAHLSNAFRGGDLYLGRQFTVSSVGSAFLDGCRFRYRYKNLAEIEVFGGTAVDSENPETIRSLSDNLVLGARFTARPVRSTRLGLHWLQKKRDGDLSIHRLGLDWSQYLGRFEYYGRAAYNIGNLRIAHVLGRVSVRSGRWSLSGEYIWREPSIDAYSIFSLVDFDRIETLRSELRRSIWKSLSLLGHVEVELGSDDQPVRTGLGLSGPYYSLAWIYQTGYAGDNNGLQGRLDLPLGANLDVRASANLYRYRVQLEQVGRSDSYAASVGFHWNAATDISVQSELQYLRNAVSSEDLRLFCRVVKDFTLSPGVRNKQR